MLLYFDKGRIASKSYGIDRLYFYHHGDRLRVEFNSGSENGMASLENVENKRFLVERAPGKLDCKHTEVKDLKVARCKGNVQVKNLPS